VCVCVCVMTKGVCVCVWWPKACVCVCVCVMTKGVCVCVCVWWPKACVCVCVWWPKACVCVCVCVCVCFGIFPRGFHCYPVKEHTSFYSSLYLNYLVGNFLLFSDHIRPVEFWKWFLCQLIADRHKKVILLACLWFIIWSLEVPRGIAKALKGKVHVFSEGQIVKAFSQDREGFLFSPVIWDTNCIICSLAIKIWELYWS
jgi:hypothetical protein